MISICVPYYSNPKMLEKQLENWTSWHKSLRNMIEFVIVDDGSPEPLKVPKVDLNLTVHRIKRNLPWNFSGAKNLLMYEALTPWVLLHDIDYTFDEQGIECLFDLREDPYKFYNFKCIMAKSGKMKPKDHYPISSFFVNKEMFWRCGGHDEDLVSFYTAHDNAVFWRLTRDPGLLTQVKLDIPVMTCWQRSQIEDADTDHEKEGWSRDGTRNRKLLGDKRQGRVPWSNQCLRFDFAQVQSMRMKV